MPHITGRALALGFGIAAGVGCDHAGPLAPDEPSAADQSLVHRGADGRLDPALCALGRGDFTLRSTNDYFPLGVGSTWKLRGTENGKQVELHVTVLRKTKVVGGVRTRIVEERHFENGELIERSRNFFASTSAGTVCYFGEDVDIYEDGEIVAHTGAWRADAPGNAPGIIMPADPRVGMTFAMEGAPKVAEDVGQIVDKAFRVRVPAGTFKKTIRIRESNPLDGDVGFKVFARAAGIIVDGPLNLVQYRIRDAHGRDDEEEDDD